MRLIIVLVAVVVAALAVTELTMQPSSADRAALLVIFGVRPNSVARTTRVDSRRPVFSRS